MYKNILKMEKLQKIQNKVGCYINKIMYLKCTAQYKKTNALYVKSRP